ncbi:hypothetical protein K7432_014076 [Basidiobolus ranarum]|uniref:Derlin n=1 Tax=Basidiobolus ranarum TaxID=34480 RepID=A0ABR2WI65_9FUNG
MRQYLFFTHPFFGSMLTMLRDNEFIQWFRSIPISTKLLTVSTLVTAAAISSRGVYPQNLVYYPEHVYGHHEYWRLLTCFFCSEISFSFVFRLYILYTFSRQLESSPLFSDSSLGYPYFLLLTMLSSIAFSSTFVDLIVFHETLIMSITFLWARYYKDVTVVLLPSIRFQGSNVPYLLMIYTFLTRNGELPYDQIIGAISAYIYCYIYDVQPTNQGPQAIRPAILHHLFPISGDFAI